MYVVRTCGVLWMMWVCIAMLAACPGSRPEAEPNEAESERLPSRSEQESPPEMETGPEGKANTTTTTHSPPPTKEEESNVADVRSDSGSKASDRAAVLKAATARIAAWKKRDLNGVMSFYEPEVMAIEKGSEDMDIHGLRHRYREEFTAKTASGINYTLDTVWSSSTMAVTQYTRITTLKGKGIRDRGIEVWRKHPDKGVWQIHRLMQYRDDEDNSRGRITRTPLPSFNLTTIADAKARARANEVAAASKALYKAYEALEMDKIDALVAPDALFMFPGRPDRSKRSALRDLRELARLRATVKANQGVEEIVTSEELAVVAFVVTQSARIPGQGSMAGTERGMDIWRRSDGGGWRIIGSAQYTSDY
ncbi:MAG: nuclear transport factor 2 family protein [Myxococcota bacterium]